MEESSARDLYAADTVSFSYPLFICSPRLLRHASGGGIAVAWRPTLANVLFTLR